MHTHYYNRDKLCEYKVRNLIELAKDDKKKKRTNMTREEEEHGVVEALFSFTTTVINHFYK